MEYSKYIVPIYNGLTLIGTGVLHNSLLVTAAHVVEDCYCGIKLSFHYRQNHYALSESDILFFEYDKEKKGVYRDLAIFKTDIDIKGLSLESEKLYDGETAFIYGYYDYNDDNLLINQCNGIIRLKPFWDKNLRINIAMNQNSFLLMDVSAIYECNSGCPLIHNEKVIGLVSQGNPDIKYIRLVSSNHIIEVMSKIKIE